MKVALIDASSAILLHKAKLFDSVAAAYKLMMTPAVYKEVTVVGRDGAAHFQALCQYGRVGLAVKPSGGHRDDGLSGLGAGERETLRAYTRGGADFVILDDRKGVAYCRSMAIPHINALLCPKVLHWSGHLDQSAYTRIFTHLLEQGRYGSHVVEFAMKCSHRRLRDFMP